MNETLFGPLMVAWDRRVLRPRPWTLIQSEWAVELASSAPPGPLLELCCGAGHIGLAAAVASGRAIVQVDADPLACEWAATNAARAGVASDVRCADVRERPFPGLGRGERFPVVLADPPYLRSDAVARYPDDPVLAIDGGATGLDLITACVELALAHATADGAVLLQIRGVRQATELDPQLRSRIEEVRQSNDEHAVERAVVLLRERVGHR